MQGSSAAAASTVPFIIVLDPPATASDMAVVILYKQHYCLTESGHMDLMHTYDQGQQATSRASTMTWQCCGLGTA